MNYQNDPRWKDDYMFAPPDPIGRWGCLISAIANTYELIKGVKMTPGEINKIFQDQHCYLGAPPEVRSCLDTNKAAKALGIKIINPTSIIEDDVQYIGRIVTAMGGHYINLIKKFLMNGQSYWLYYDTWDNGVKSIREDKVTKYIGVK